MKILIFRTDRVGDFILTSILLNSIKKNFSNVEIHVVASPKNYNFVKNSILIDNVYLFPSKKIINIYKFIKLLRENFFDYIIIADGKDRSILLSFLLKCRFRIINIRKKIFLFFKILKKNLIIYDNEKKLNKLELIKKNLFYLNAKFEYSDLDIFNKREKILYLSKKFKNFTFNNFILFHFDEKWITNKYISSYTSIEPSLEQLEKFISQIALMTNKDVVITNGFVENFLFNRLRENFNKIENNLYSKLINTKKLILVDKVSFEELIDIVSISRLIITCHGAPTHVASSFNVKIIDIIEKNKEDFYNVYTSHLRNYNKIYRQDFSKLTNEIFSLIT